MPPAVAQHDRFGFDFVNGAEYSVPDSRYQQAVNAGAGWTRWPLYWGDIETSPGSFNYGPQDDVVSRDRAHGLAINAILLGTPSWAAVTGFAEVPGPRVERRGLTPEGALTVFSHASSVPANLYQPVFRSDGSINRDNYWGYFVFKTVERYRGRVRFWEMWNEPDLKDEHGNGVFWSGSREDYYQLLKVGYLAAKAADPSAVVLFGGLAYWTDPGFFPYVLDLMKSDPSAPANNYYFDAVAFHFYADPQHIWNFTHWAREQMQARGIASKPVWINEANIPVCDDAQVDVPFCPSIWRGTMDEQASYAIQAMALALAAGVERLILFQFYDDGLGTPQTHEWFGFVRNSGSPRPAYRAFQVGAYYLAQPVNATRVSDGAVDRVTVLTARGRVTIVWNRTTVERTVSVPANGSQAVVVEKDGTERTIASSGGTYTLTLRPATYRQPPDNGPGGSPLLIVEPLTPLRSFVPFVPKGSP